MLGSAVTVKHESKWTFKTSGTGGIGIEFVAASRGTVVLLDPGGAEQRFHYRAGGVGASAGIRKIPKIGRINPGRLDPRGFSDHGGGTVAPESFPNHGRVFVMDGCQHDELTHDDFNGICVVVDAGLGLIVGYSGAIMLMGVDPASLAIYAVMHSNPILGMVAPPIQCKAMVLSCGWNVGPQASVGITGQLGWVWS